MSYMQDKDLKKNRALFSAAVGRVRDRSSSLPAAEEEIELAIRETRQRSAVVARRAVFAKRSAGVKP